MYGTGHLVSGSVTAVEGGVLAQVAREARP